MQPHERRRRTKKHPWEVLAFAALFLFVGVFMLGQREPMFAYHQSLRPAMDSQVSTLSPQAAHLVGTIALVVAIALVVLYFYIRRAAARDGG